MKLKLLAIALLVSLNAAVAQEQPPAKNLFIVVVDGVRWKEVFEGASKTVVKANRIGNDTIVAKYMDGNAYERRSKLLPFIWSYAAANGQLRGNRHKGSYFEVKNKLKFSAPGYSEIVCGFPDDKAVKSNERKYNPNINLLEVLNNTAPLKGKVAVFGSWDRFEYIVNSPRSNLYVSNGFTRTEHTQYASLVDSLNALYPSPWHDVRRDVVTFKLVQAYIQRHHPRVVFISFGETDEYAHENNYPMYLSSMHSFDGFLKQLWQLTQEDPFYKHTTAFIISTDHGRGDDYKNRWNDHGRSIRRSNETWLVAYGAGVIPLGEVKNNGHETNSQIAATAASLLNVSYNSSSKISPPLINVIAPKASAK